MSRHWVLHREFGYALDDQTKLTGTNQLVAVLQKTYAGNCKTVIILPNEEKKQMIETKTAPANTAVACQMNAATRPVAQTFAGAKDLPMAADVAFAAVTVV